MWTASIAKEEKTDGTRWVTFTYSDGVRSIVQSQEVNEAMTNDSLTKLAIENIDLFSKRDAAYTAITNGTLDVGGKIPPVPVPTLRDIYYADLRLLSGMKRAVADGLMKADDKAYLDLQAKVKAEFLPEYLEDQATVAAVATDILP